MEKNKHINEDNFDELLRDHLLHGKTDDAFANAVMQQHYDVPVDPAKEQQMLTRVNKKIGNGGGYFPYLYGGLIALIIIALSVYFVTVKSDGSKTRKHDEAKKKNYSLDPAKAVSAISQTLLDTSAKNPGKDTFGSIQRMFTLLPVDPAPGYPVENAQSLRKIDPALLPHLNETDRVKYAAIKQQMLERLYKLDKDLYTHINADKLNYAGKDIAVDAFSIRNVAITNLEYKAFLADLIAQGRTEEYYKSEVLNLRWNSEGCPGLASAYYADDKYNDFPVVNLSLGAAGIFCKWMSEELQKYSEQNKLKKQDFLIRLPYDKEWILAARNGYAKISYETGYNTLYEPKEGLVDYTFVKRLNQIKKRSLLRDSVYELYITNRYGWEEQQLKDFLNKAFSGFSYLPADTIYPERMKLYGKIGHVSEMVPQFNSAKIWLSGFTWKSKEYYTNFEEKFKLVGVSPFVGFRIVVINKQDPEFKSPFW